MGSYAWNRTLDLLKEHGITNEALAEMLYELMLDEYERGGRDGYDRAYQAGYDTAYLDWKEDKS